MRHAWKGLEEIYGASVAQTHPCKGLQDEASTGRTLGQLRNADHPAQDDRPLQGQEAESAVALLTKIVIAVAAGSAIAAAGLVVAGWLVWGRGDGAVAEPMPDFSTLALHGKPNQYLSLPPDFASAAAPHGESPVFDLPVAELERRALDAIRMQPRVTAIASDPARRQHAFVQRSALMRFPDTVTVRFVAADGGRSSLALYSRSKVGHSDLGANRERARAWLEAIAAATGASRE